MDHMPKWLRFSASVRFPLPTCSMSGSFQPPGPPYGASAAWLSIMPLMEPQFGAMSWVVRHRLATSLPQVQGWVTPYSEMP